MYFFHRKTPPSWASLDEPCFTARVMTDGLISLSLLLSPPMAGYVHAGLAALKILFWPYYYHVTPTKYMSLFWRVGFFHYSWLQMFSLKNWLFFKSKCFLMQNEYDFKFKRRTYLGFTWAICCPISSIFLNWY